MNKGLHVQGAIREVPAVGMGREAVLAKFKAGAAECEKWCVAVPPKSA